MTRGGRAALIDCAVVAVALVGGLTGAKGGAACQDIVKQKPQGMYTQYCGPARAVALVHRKTYRFSHGSCEVSLDRKVRVFNVQVGYVQDSWTSAYKKLGEYRGAGTVTVRAGESGGVFAAPVPDDLGPAVDRRDAPTTRISGSFTCR